MAGTNCQVFPLPAPCATADSALHPRFPRYDDYTDSQSRLGASLSFQWKPNDKNLMSVDALYSDYRGTRQEQYLEAPGFQRHRQVRLAHHLHQHRQPIAVLSDTINSQGVMTAGTFELASTPGVEDRFEQAADQVPASTFLQRHAPADRQALGG